LKKNHTPRSERAQQSYFEYFFSSGAKDPAAQARSAQRSGGAPAPAGGAKKGTAEDAAGSFGAATWKKRPPQLGRERQQPPTTTPRDAANRKTPFNVYFCLLLLILLCFDVLASGVQRSAGVFVARRVRLGISELLSGVAGAIRPQDGAAGNSRSADGGRVDPGSSDESGSGGGGGSYGHVTSLLDEVLNRVSGKKRARVGDRGVRRGGSNSMTRHGRRDLGGGRRGRPVYYKREQPAGLGCCMD
jgi:hypothetical protein